MMNTKELTYYMLKDNMINTQVCIGMPSANWLNVNMASFLYQVVRAYDVNILHTQRTEICSARNKIINEFLQTDSDYLLFLDDDNIPENLSFLESLIEADKDIISGLVPSRLPDHTWAHRLCVFDEETKQTGQHVYKQLYKIPDGDEIQEIVNFWMWCVLIKREVLEAMSANHTRPCEMRDVRYYKVDWHNIADYEIDPYWIPEWTLRYKRYMSEDLLFFEKAKKLWYKTWIHKWVRCEHDWITLDVLNKNKDKYYIHK